MAKLVIVNPIAEAQAGTGNTKRFPPAPRPVSLNGKRVGFFWNAKAGGELALARTKEHLQRLFPTASFVDYFGDEGTHMRRASKNMAENMSREVDVVVGATAD